MAAAAAAARLLLAVLAVVTSSSEEVQAQSRHGGRYVAARDREIDFGKFKGSLLGTTSSKYLKWMVKNLRGGPTSEWVEYAEEVLEDPCYKDRLEWEKVEKLMTMAHDVDKITGNRDVLAPARVFGWNLEDDSGWRKVNFALLGTTQGGKIPRVTESAAAAAPVEKKKRVRRQSVSVRTQPASLSTSESAESASQGSLRDELARRWELRRDRHMANRGLKAAAVEEEAKQVLNPFPGRDSLVSKGDRKPFVMETVKADTKAKIGKEKTKPLPIFLGNIIAYILNLVGPKGLEFSRYSLDYHTTRNYLYVYQNWAKKRADEHTPTYAKKLVAMYNEKGDVDKLMGDIRD